MQAHVDTHLADLSNLDRLYSGPKSMVFRGPAPGTVTKVYHRDGERTARIEYERLTLLYEAFQGVDGVRCPRPLGLSTLGGRTALTMEEVPGESLLDLAERPDRPSPAHIAELLASALRTFDDVIQEPYHGIKPQDVFLTDGARDLLLLDFEQNHSGWHNGVEPLACHASSSAAVLLGRVLHVVSAPRMLLRKRERRWLIEVALATSNNLSPTDRDGFAAMVEARYRRGYQRYDSLPHTLWYRLRWAGLGRPALRHVGDAPERERWSPLARLRALSPTFANLSDDLILVADLTII